MTQYYGPTPGTIASDQEAQVTGVPRVWGTEIDPDTGLPQSGWLYQWPDGSQHSAAPPVVADKLRAGWASQEQQRNQLGATTAAANNAAQMTNAPVQAAAAPRPRYTVLPGNIGVFDNVEGRSYRQDQMTPEMRAAAGLPPLPAVTVPTLAPPMGAPSGVTITGSDGQPVDNAPTTAAPTNLNANVGGVDFPGGVPLPMPAPTGVVVRGSDGLPVGNAPTTPPPVTTAPSGVTITGSDGKPVDNAPTAPPPVTTAPSGVVVRGSDGQPVGNAPTVAPAPVPQPAPAPAGPGYALPRLAQSDANLPADAAGWDPTSLYLYGSGMLRRPAVPTGVTIRGSDGQPVSNAPITAPFPPTTADPEPMMHTMETPGLADRGAQPQVFLQTPGVAQAGAPSNLRASVGTPTTDSGVKYRVQSAFPTPGLAPETRVAAAATGPGQSGAGGQRDDQGDPPVQGPPNLPHVPPSPAPKAPPGFVYGVEVDQYGDPQWVLKTDPTYQLAGKAEADAAAAAASKAAADLDAIRGKNLEGQTAINAAKLPGDLAYQSAQIAQIQASIDNAQRTQAYAERSGDRAAANQAAQQAAQLQYQYNALTADYQDKAANRSLSADLGYAQSRREDAAQTGYLVSGAPTLAREQAVSDTELNQAKFQSDRANQAAQIALSQGNQAEAKRQFNIKQSLDDYIQRGQLSLQQQSQGFNQQLQTAQWQAQQRANPASFLDTAYAQRGMATPTLGAPTGVTIRGSDGQPVGNAPTTSAPTGLNANVGGQDFPGDPTAAQYRMQYQSMATPGVAATAPGLATPQPAYGFATPQAQQSQQAPGLGGSMNFGAGSAGQQSDQPFAPQKPLSYDEINRSGAQLPGLAAAFGGQDLSSGPRTAGNVPYLSAQKLGQLTGTERSGLSAELSATGNNPTDYFEQVKRLSATGNSPSSFVTRRVAPQRAYSGV